MDDVPIQVDLPPKVKEALDDLAEQAILGETAEEVARYFLLRSLDDFHRDLSRRKIVR